MTKLFCALWTVVIGLTVPLFAAAQSPVEDDVFAFLNARLNADCDAIPVPELLKYRDCLPDYVIRRDDFIAQQEELAAKAL